MVDRATDEEPQVAAVVDEPADERDPGRAVGCRERLEERPGLLPVRRAEQLVHLLQRDRAVGKRDDHIEHALGVAQRALRVPRDHLERRPVGTQVLLLDDLGELRDHAFVGDAPEVEALCPRDDRGRDALRFSRREDEDRVRRRLLERLQ